MLDCLSKRRPDWWSRLLRKLSASKKKTPKTFSSVFSIRTLRMNEAAVQQFNTLSYEDSCLGGVSFVCFLTFLWTAILNFVRHAADLWLHCSPCVYTFILRLF